MPRPAAYLRKSKDAGSKADHLGLLMAAVSERGHNGDAVVYDDWAKSGDIEKIDKRTEWRRLCDAIEAGEHDVVFMNSLDRGGRSIEEWLRFVRLCRARGVRVIADGVDYSAAENRDRLIFEAWAAEKELERAKERSARTKTLRERRGDAVTGGHHARYGYMWVRAGDAGLDGDARRIVEVPNPAEPLGPLVEAVRETGGNVQAACRLLNQRGVPTRSGSPWDNHTLTRVLDGHDVMRRRSGVVGLRRRAPTEAPLSRLVACHCGSLMTPSRDPRKRDANGHRSGEWLILTCSAGQRLGREAHGPYVARARHVMERLQADLRYRTIRVLTAAPKAAPSRLADLEDRRRRLGIALADDAIPEADYRRRMDALKAEIAAAEDDGASRSEWADFSPSEPLVDWSAPAAQIGERLRRLVRVVRLGADMRPAAIEWRAPWIARAKTRKAN